jgi:hypothetical protein
MIDWPNDLVEDLAARRCVLFLGAGVSKNSKNAMNERPKDWVEYLRSLAALISDTQKRAEVLGCIDEWDLLTACELARMHLRNDIFKRHLLAEYSDKAFEPAEIHDSIIKIDSRFVLTTNFEKLYENRANQVQQNTVIVKNYYDPDVADVFRRSQRAVLKIHGTIDSPDQTIFTRSSYARARIEYAHFYKLLDALFTTHTFVFLGASMRDPDLQIIMEDHAYRFEGSRPHFMIMPRGGVRESVIEVMEDSMNLHALLYDPANNHQELGDSLKALAPLVEDERTRLTQTRNW